jgi:hypothetical protein
MVFKILFGALLLHFILSGEARYVQMEPDGLSGDGWSVSGNGCGTWGGNCLNVEYSDLYLEIGDVLVFKYGSYHDVFLSDLTEKNCDFSQGRVVGGARSGMVSRGGQVGFQYELTEAGSFVFSCSRSGNRPGWPQIGTHCGKGQVVKVVVANTISSDAPQRDEGGTSACNLEGTWQTTYGEIQFMGDQGAYLDVWGGQYWDPAAFDGFGAHKDHKGSSS